MYLSLHEPMKKYKRRVHSKKLNKGMYSLLSSYNNDKKKNMHICISSLSGSTFSLIAGLDNI